MLPPEQDIPELDSTIVRLPSDIREDLARKGTTDLFMFAHGILGYKDMTESAHGALCVFVNDNPKRFKMMLMPRDHYKTSVITISANMQKGVRNPEERILIANESSTNAERMLRAVRQHCEGNKIFRALYSGVIPKDIRKARWNDKELDFQRQGKYPEPTFDTIGMTGAVTSRHYSHICIDDPISEEAVKSEKVMADTITRLSGFPALLTKPKTDSIWIVGTRWAIHDVYSWFQEKLGEELAIFARGAIENGQPIFPELMDLTTLALKRQMMGEYRFSCLMMNNPRNEELQDLNVNDLLYWEWADSAKTRIRMLDRAGQEIRTLSLDQLQITTTVDLAPAETITSDRNAVVTVGVTPWNEVIVLEAWGRRCTPIELIEKLFEVGHRFQISKLGIEGVAYQKAFKYFLKQEADRRMKYFRVVELTATGKKEHRIRGLQPIMATGRMFVNKLEHQMLIQEMSDFPLGQHDDVLDGLSMQLQLMPTQLSPDHWDKLKKAEADIVRRIHRGDTSMASGGPRRGWDYEDVDDSDLTPSPQVSSVIIG